MAAIHFEFDVSTGSKTSFDLELDGVKDLTALKHTISYNYGVVQPEGTYSSSVLMLKADLARPLIPQQRHAIERTCRHKGIQGQDWYQGRWPCAKRDSGAFGSSYGWQLLRGYSSLFLTICPC